MRVARGVLVLITGLGLVGPVGAEEGGLRIVADHETWSRWQARLAVINPPINFWAPVGAEAPAGSVRLSGDRYFDIGRLGDGGGLRATSSLSWGPRGLAAALSTPIAATLSPSPLLTVAPWSASTGAGDLSDHTATTYIGLGYSSWWNKTGLGLSADLGVFAYQPGQVNRLGRDGSEDSLRTMQVAPVLQVTLSYAF